MVAPRTNRDLFSTAFLRERLPETTAWTDVDEPELHATRETIRELWETEAVQTTDGSRVEDRFVQPVLDTLGVRYSRADRVESGESSSPGAEIGCSHRPPDYTFPVSEAGDRGSGEGGQLESGDNREPIAVADVTRWGRSLDTHGSGQYERDYEHPGHRMCRHLEAPPARWGLLTNGRTWRLYHARTSHRPDVYYEIDLQQLLATDDPEAFRYFYLFFRHEAFLEDADGTCVLDHLYAESQAYTDRLAATLQDDLREALRVFGEGLLQSRRQDRTETDLDLLYDGSLVYLYRLLFVLSADRTGSPITGSDTERTADRLTVLARNESGDRDGSASATPDDPTSLWARLEDLFACIDGERNTQSWLGEDRAIPEYQSWLFRTEPDDDAPPELRLLASVELEDDRIERVLDLLTGSGPDSECEATIVNHASLSLRRLGSIHEELLEYGFDVADEPLAVSEAEYVTASDESDVVVDEGELYLTTDAGERKATGSYYTPEHVVEYMIERTLDPLLEEIRDGLCERAASTDETVAEAFAREVFDLDVLDPAMGSGHFLLSAVEYLVRAILDAQARQASRMGVETIDLERDADWARRQVLAHCIHGVDLNPLAVELANGTLWLRTLDAGGPPATLDAHLQTGNALLCTALDESDGVKISPGADAGDQRRQRLEAVANVHTAASFGLDSLPADAVERVASALGHDDDWARIEQREWFRVAQRRAERDQYFHWQLAFPDVFRTGGFDAVVGNPPYVRSRTLSDPRKQFHRERYRTAEGAYDVYIPFLELAAELGEQHCFIVPNKWTTTDYGRELRDLLLEVHDLEEVVDLSHLTVFPDADIYPLVVSYTTGPEKAAAEQGEQETDGPTIRRVQHGSEIATAPGVTVPRDVIDQLGGRVLPVNLTPSFVSLLETALSEEHRLGDHVELTEAIHTGNVREQLVVEEPVDGTCEKLADGSSIERYHLEWSGQWIRYDESIIEGIDGAYADLRARELFDREEKLFVRDISHRPVGAYDDTGLFGLNTLYSVTSRADSAFDLRYLLAVFNSTFVTRYFRQVYGGTHVSGDYLRFKPMFSEQIPIPDPRNRAVHSDHVSELQELDADVDLSSVERTLARLTEVIRDAKAARSDLTLQLGDVLGAFADGPSLGGIDADRSGPVEDSVLAETDSSLEGLRVGSVEVTEHGDELVILASVRYKPDESTAADTDRWGYTETELQPAMSFAGLEGIERFLLREFVPYAVERSDGFAGFRENATKTISPIDRLEALTLPAIEDVREDLREYRARHWRAERLDERIERADRLIDELVSDLYGLTASERQLLRDGPQR
jgi:hypothetical protein